VATASVACGLSEEELKARLDRSRVPAHVAVIMDGNGRWARERGLRRLAGHRAGRESIRHVVGACGELGIKYLSLYTFSAENWQRPKPEVDALMELIEESLREELEELAAKEVRIRLLGSWEGLPASLVKALRESEGRTRENNGLTLQLAINYGGRQEIVGAAAGLAAEVAAGRIKPEEIDEVEFARHLYLPDSPDPDLLIRTGGDVRVSNYLLWQIAYAEIHVTPTLWPDFRKAHLCEALIDWQSRQRRFGRVGDEE
jgi:undecaprenyl diphosphate synthase